MSKNHPNRNRRVTLADLVDEYSSGEVDGMMEYKIPSSPCPFCGHVTDSATNTSQHQAIPEPGAMGVCLQCAQILQFDEQLRLVKPDTERVAEMMKISPTFAEGIRRLQRAVRAADRTRL